MVRHDLDELPRQGKIIVHRNEVKEHRRNDCRRSVRSLKFSQGKFHSNDTSTPPSA